MSASRGYTLLVLMLCLGTSLLLPTTTVTEFNSDAPVTDLVTSTLATTTTTKNPIRQFVKDLFTLYDAVSSFVKPWFGENDTTTKPTKNEETPSTESTDEPQFADFEDPDTNIRNESESRRLEQIESETFLRYVRSVNQTALNNFAHHIGNNFLQELKRKKRDIMDPNEIFKWVVQAFIDQARTLWQENSSSVSRHVRDVWDLNKSNFMNHALAVWEGRETVTSLFNTLIRITRDVSERSVGKDRTEALVRHVREVQESRQNLFEGYYDFAINEWSYKFWAVYMLGASALLTYSAIAAIYYGKFNTNAIDYETYDDIGRSNNPSASSNPLGLVGSLVSVHTFQKIMEALSSSHFS